MVDSDLIAAIQNALERQQHIESIINSLINAGYPKDEVKEAARHAQFNLQQAQMPMSVPSPSELRAPASTAPLPATFPTPTIPTAGPTTTAGMYKPLPTIHTSPSLKQPAPKNKKFFWFLIILNIIALIAVAYLIIKLI